MISTNIRTNTYIVILMAAFIMSLIRWRVAGNAIRMISILLGFTIVIEVLAAFSAVKYHNNLAIYHIYTPIETILLLLYFKFLHPELKKRKVIPILIILSLAAFVLNTIYLQPMTKELDSNMMLYSDLIIVGFSLYTFYTLFSVEDLNFRITSSSRFWICLLLLFYCCSTFILWDTMQIFRHREMKRYLSVAYFAIWVLNLTFYSGIGLVFYFIPKLET